ncbi:TetR/AcrR family transcriptional regulator [Amycolatopsis regifaucium]|uniref:HTH tetR-type domain-containing protein n=1 Tax=Amycolatopsis regifaucium TaxID=546365 RepID=A0A154MNX0_9PSEU|nr:TetR/AcrR family transcriptional regulator [Amycolatopsis regifaucium]KZB86001.1 hypothetical protein AVL48_27785 [Amycolatopsis regifaucium]SFH74392.1 regulatory protein, tetR family [Amycolatopsis regifaucium]
MRVAAREGLHAVTMRSVAAESGVSLRLVQYYFDSKEQLLRGALRHLEKRSHDRWGARLVGLPKPVPPRAFVEAFLNEARDDGQLAPRADVAMEAARLVSLSHGVGTSVLIGHKMWTAPRPCWDIAWTACSGG